jgi:4-hydroxy-3-methylbut-2-en-1-yl diphosphate reductase
MSRTVVRECLAPGTTVAPGEVLVATEVGDPAQGVLPCPAAPLVGGLLRRRGIPVRYAPVPHCAEAAPSGDGAALFLTSAMRRDGAATGIGAAVDGVDAVAAAAARAAVEEWSAVVGTRRLLRTPAPWCEGARRAMRWASEAVACADGPVYVYGDLAGSPYTRAGLAESGAVFTASLAEIPDGATVLFPAHGVTPAVLAEARQRGLAVVDATCPLVTMVHQEVRRFAERGDQVVVIGPPGHAVAAGLAGQAPGRTVTVESPASAGGVGVASPRRVSYVLQPGVPVEEMVPVSAALRSRFPALRGPDPGGFCYAASDWAETARAVAAGSEVVLVLGDSDHPDSRQLAARIRAAAAKAHVIADTAAIVPSWLAGVEALGLAEATTAHPGLAGEVTAALSGLGPLSVTTRQVTTEAAVAAGGFR